MHQNASNIRLYQANQDQSSTVQFGELPKVNSNVPGLSVVRGLAESNRKVQCAEHFFDPKLTDSSYTSYIGYKSYIDSYVRKDIH